MGGHLEKDTVYYICFVILKNSFSLFLDKTENPPSLVFKQVLEYLTPSFFCNR